MGRTLSRPLPTAVTVEDWTECSQTHRHTEVKTVYPPVLLRSLGGYNYADLWAEQVLLLHIISFTGAG